MKQSLPHLPGLCHSPNLLLFGLRQSIPCSAINPIARGSLAGSQILAQSTEGKDPLASALEKYALAEKKVGEARLAQDSQIQLRFLTGWNTVDQFSLSSSSRFHDD
ncbi:BAR domain-containing family [Penicillium citrinum]|uniref:BAR domain-containing family n=1 Tax=Penicillium citrinum TaxID=5077 RepID=A0A9W9NYG1_PENCI|nr:BAR domain-containing family [Penicillium citrinum]KAJ5231950.1 BAR domain-containing family [Penicillium citrinum]